MKFLQPVFLFFLIVLIPHTLLAQQPEKSEVLEQIGDQVFYIHLVQPGETIESIAQVYEVDKDAIYDLTPGLESGETIRANHILRIPFTEETLEKDAVQEEQVAPVAPSGELNQQKTDKRKKQDILKDRPDEKKKRFEYHRVQPKETLYSLAKAYDVSMDDIRKVNPGLEDEIKVGQTLMIPVYLAEQPGEDEEEDEEEAVVKKDKEQVFKGKKFSLYTVKPRENVFRIAKNFGVSQQELLEMNPAVEEEGLKAGQQIRIPHETEEEVTKDTEPAEVAHDQDIVAAVDQDSIQTVRHYKVGFLERLPGIAKRQDVELKKIYQLNPGIKEEGVSWGDVIKLPRKAEVKEEEKDKEEEDAVINYITHEVMKKETLYRISKLYDVPQEDIIALNPGADRGIKRGEILRIPVRVPEPEEEVTEEKTEEEEDALMKEEQQVRCEERQGEEQRYSVALMIPFYLDEYQSIDTGKIDNEIPLPSSMNFAQFYGGAMLAVDSLEKQGLKADVYVYDVGKTRAEAQKKLDKTLEDMDLIIGPIYSDAFNVVQEFAQSHGIKIVNPLSTREEIIAGNRDVFKVQPPVESELEAIADYIHKYYTDSISIFVVRNNRYQQSEEIKYLREALSEKGIGLSQKNRVYEVDYSYDSLHPVLDSTKWAGRNIVVALADREVFTIELVRHLNEMHDSIPDVTLFGMSEWRKYDLETSYLMNLDVHIFDNTFTDYARPELDWFVRKFRERYATEPMQERYAFAGYDITYYFLSAMYRYGSDFAGCLKFHHPALLMMEMQFIENEYGSYENRSAFPLRYYNYRLLKIEQQGPLQYQAEKRRRRF
jgi:LysM repeat protein/ABC-type branched-subunit amino acid transport system substrate-binding protein